MEMFTRKDCINASFDYHKILHLLSNQEVEKVICEVENFLNTSKNYFKLSRFLYETLEKLNNDVSKKYCRQVASVYFQIWPWLRHSMNPSSF